MDFLSKQFNRVGKQSENFQITFRPLILKVNVYTPSQYYVVFKRGPQKDETKKYKLEPSSNGLQMQQLIFDEDEMFQRVSGFYLEKDGRYQKKSADIMIRCINSVKEEKISDVSINLAMYIGRGLVKDSIQLTGAAFFLDFEIEVQKSLDGTNVRSSIAGVRSSMASNDHGTEGTYSDGESESNDNSTKNANSSSLRGSSNNVTPTQDRTESAVFNPPPQVIHQQPAVANPQQQNQLNDLTNQLVQQQKQGKELRSRVEQLQKQIQEVTTANTKLQVEVDGQQADLEKRKEVEGRWKKRCEYLEEEVGKLQKEANDFYSADRFD